MRLRLFWVSLLLLSSLNSCNQWTPTKTLQTLVEHQTLPVERIVTDAIDAPPMVAMEALLVTTSSTPTRLPLYLSGDLGTGCTSIPVSGNTPTGIAGCSRWGQGIASYYGPGIGVAMNFCTWSYRHKHGCGWVMVKSLSTRLQARVPVVDFCDCYTGTPDERIIDLQYDVVQLLGLNMSKGLYEVEIWRVN